MTDKYQRKNLIVDAVYWLHPDDRANFRAVRIMHSDEQVNLYADKVFVQTPLQSILDQALQDAAFFNKIEKTDKHTQTQWLVKHLAGLHGQIVDDQVVVDFTLSNLNSGMFQSGGKHHSMFRDAFLVWHVKRSVSNKLVMVLSVKDNKGWELGSVLNS